MKIIFFVCVAILPSIIHCGSSSGPKYDSRGYEIDTSLESEQLKIRLNQTACNNGIINGIFMPSKDGYLGVGSFGVMYKGILQFPNSRAMEVAMKFTHIGDKKNADQEYEIYSYLYAIDNPKVELYGIPAVYYYGTWEEYIMMGITLLDSGFKNTLKAGQFNEIDLLIICKEFMRAIKYIHSCGIWHNDIRFPNMMFRRNNGFIIDFNVAEKMYFTNKLGPKSKKHGIKCAKNDWKRFLQSLNDFCSVDIFLSFDMSKPETKEEIETIMTTLETMSLYSEIKTVSIEMAEYIFGLKNPSESNVSAYDRAYAVIEEEIELFGGEPPALVHWLTRQEEDIAKQEYAMNQIPQISSINDHSQYVQFAYPDVNWNYFENKIAQLNSGGTSSGKARKTFSTSGSSKFGSNDKKKRHGK